MDTLEAAIKLMKPGCFITSIDLQDAYYSIPVAPTYRKYLKSMWRGQLFQFKALPMGLITSSPRIFISRIAEQFVDIGGASCHSLTHFIVNFLSVNF
jgi:hypothetical protein